MSAALWVLWGVALGVCLALCTLFLFLAVLEVRRVARLEDAARVEVAL